LRQVVQAGFCKNLIFTFGTQSPLKLWRAVTAGVQRENGP